MEKNTLFDENSVSEALMVVVRLITGGWHDSLVDESTLEYLTRMSRDGTYGDHSVLQAASEVYRRQIIIVSSFAQGNTIIQADVFKPRITPNFPTTPVTTPEILFGSSDVEVEAINSQNHALNNTVMPTTVSATPLISTVESDLQLLSLPQEILAYIFDLAVEDNLFYFKRLESVPKFSDLLIGHIEVPPKPRINLNSTNERALNEQNKPVATIAVKTLKKIAGQSSRVYLAVKKLLQFFDGWQQCFIILNKVRVGLHYVANII